MQDDAADLRVQDSHCLYEGERSRLNPVLLGALYFLQYDEAWWGIWGVGEWRFRLNQVVHSVVSLHVWMIVIYIMMIFPAMNLEVREFPSHWWHCSYCWGLSIPAKGGSLDVPSCHAALREWYVMMPSTLVTDRMENVARNPRQKLNWTCCTRWIWDDWIIFKIFVDVCGFMYIPILKFRVAPPSDPVLNFPHGISGTKCQCHLQSSSFASRPERRLA